jgi:hypothetical protein
MNSVTLVVRKNNSNFSKKIIFFHTTGVTLFMHANCKIITTPVNAVSQTILEFRSKIYLLPQRTKIALIYAVLGEAA